MRAIVTRPAREAEQWCEGLRQRGLDALCWPLIEIRASADAARVHAAWAALAQTDAALFVSANAVDFFLAQNPPLARVPFADDAIKTVAYAPGPGTARALLSQGALPARVFSPAADSAQFDSEALWRVVQAQVGPGFRLLVVRGTSAGAQQDSGVGRDWFAQQVLQRGGSVDHVVVYERARPQWDAAQCARAAAAASDGSVWLFSSSEAVAHLGQLLAGQDWRRARCVCTHPRIAQTARDAGLGVVCESRPTLEAVAASIESLQ
ncbi:MAG: uroporphyrinogen-III synthase [Rhodoferax sp.]